jgi:hypothetical protein
MLTLSDKWAPILVAQSETGMGYQIAHVLLVDGTQVDYLVIVGGVVTEAVGSNDIPFSEDQIVDIRVTHGKLVINSAPFTESDFASNHWVLFALVHSASGRSCLEYTGEILAQIESVAYTVVDQRPAYWVLS